MTPEEEEPRVSGSRFGIEHILDERFSPPGFNGSWISGNNTTNTFHECYEYSDVPMYSSNTAM